MKKSLSFFCLFALPILSAYATDVAQIPIEASGTVKPNIIFALDDSGSMDFEILLRTNDGSLWWNINDVSFFDANGNPLFNESGQVGSSWRKFSYLFPNGTAGSDTRNYSDSSGHYAIPPIPKYAFARNPAYNTIYYDPMVEYRPWQFATVDGQTMIFADINPIAAPSHPVFSRADNHTMDLTAIQFSKDSNFTFRMYGGDVIPGDIISGIESKRTGRRWRKTNKRFTIPSGRTYDVAVPYYPATYYINDPACVTGYPDCATAPDGMTTMRRYEIKPGVIFPSGRSYSDELQNFANWFSYYRKRKLLLSSAMGDVLVATGGIRAGITKFNDLNAVTMYNFDSQDDSANTRVLLGEVYTNPARGTTPTRDALAYVGEQFKTNKAVIEHACQMNAAMVLTDGFAATSSVTVPAYNPATYGNGSPYTTTYSGSLADIALAYYTNNLRVDFTSGLVDLNSDPTGTNPDTNKDLHMNTYALSLGPVGTIYGTNSAAAQDPFTTAPAWPNPNITRSPTSVDDLWHATINGRGLMFNAGKASEARQALKQALTDALIKAGAAAAIGVATVNITADSNKVYLSSYNNVYGNLEAVTIDVNTGLVNKENTLWSARDQLDKTIPTGRVIATYNGTLGVPLQWDSLPNDMKAQLHRGNNNDGENVLEWLRGKRDLDSNSFRTRLHLLGDIVYAEPVSVQGALASFTAQGYSDYKNTVHSRPQVIYQAANDGMLHTFDGATGNELWAYMPSLIFNKVKKLSEPNYQHEFFVDATPRVGEVYYDDAWHTILVGGLRAGGRGFYAIDVTHPETITNEADLASKVLWEFPNASTPEAIANNVGLSFGRPIITKTRALGWVVLVTAGYNNIDGDGKGHVFVLDPKTGKLLYDFNTQVGSQQSPSGLAHLVAYSDSPLFDPFATFVYGGDLQGNVWRFDFSGKQISDWNIKKIAQLVDNSGNVQPITTEIELTKYKDKRILYVGTGQLLGYSDISNTSTQSMYGLVDDLSDNPTISPLRSSLVKRTVTGEQITGDEINYSSKKGWYFDFPNAGERMNTNAVIAFGSLIFNTNQPSVDSCTSRSFRYFVNSVSGTVNNQEVFGNAQAWARREIGKTFVSRPVVLVLANRKTVSVNYQSNTSVSVADIPTQGGDEVRVISWREILFD